MDSVSFYHQLKVMNDTVCVQCKSTERQVSLILLEEPIKMAVTINVEKTKAAKRWHWETCMRHFTSETGLKSSFMCSMWTNAFLKCP